MVTIPKASKPVALMSKNLTKEEKEARLEAEEKVKTASDKVYECPMDIVKSEQEVYMFIVEEMRELDLLTNLDIERIKICANAVVNIRQARVLIRKYGLVYEKPDGSLQKNPAVNVLKDYEAIYSKCEKELCLSPQSRMMLSKIMAEASAKEEDEILKLLGGDLYKHTQ